ncbi:metallophosphoesterase family protein [Variovorax sp. PAMC 28711]|uniref:metallophosphoesterase family protein n=1 Tax=Variovorax sp. PAMC 28711 TaxID=1795631 RepID=UPI00078E457D|nr:metallophosphoesterase family protein [Variovorax sp. PAMC 28711]AMM24791.1 hypothetical protein AX767_10830 [Variovorax sp. PAMC 28711]
MHDMAVMQLEPADVDVRMVVLGHSHKTSIVEGDDVLFINLGSAGPWRFSLPILVAGLLIDDGRVRPRMLTLALWSQLAAFV